MEPRLNWFNGLLLMVLHAILMWVVIPIGFIAWVFVHNWLQKAECDECLGWYDLNLGAFLQRVLLRPIIPAPTLNWIPFKNMTEVTHRVWLFDFF
jgi:hypothetical protein